MRLRRYLGSGAVWVLLAALLFPPILVAGTVTVREASVVLRSGPGVEHPQIDKLARGESLEVLGRSGDWYRVSRYGQQGWVFAALVSEPSGEVPEQPTRESHPNPAEAPASAPSAEEETAPAVDSSLPTAARDNILRTSKGDIVVADFKPGEEYLASIETSRGTIVVLLWPDVAPNHVKNFIHLCGQDYYDGLTIHRVIPQFLIQGGDPKGDGTGGPGYTIALEPSARAHEAGILSMAHRLKDLDSAGSQFFIMLETHPFLDGKYTPFGTVVTGMDVVRKLSMVETNEWDQPTNRIEIRDVIISKRNRMASKL